MGNVCLRMPLRTTTATEPGRHILAEEAAKPAFVIVSLAESINADLMSPDDSQGMVPSQYSWVALFGVPPLNDSNRSCTWQLIQPSGTPASPSSPIGAGCLF